MSFIIINKMNVTLTLTDSVVQKIDSVRGDINRSKFILRILEKAVDLDQGDEIAA
jgi:hypothetical protein